MCSCVERSIMLVVNIILALFSRMITADSFPWTISLTVSNEPDSVFEGPVEIEAVFENGLWHSVTSPFNRYESGKEYSFSIDFQSPGPLQTVYTRTRSLCPLGLHPTELLHLQKLVLISEEKNSTYSKLLPNLAIADTCGSDNYSLSTEIRDFGRVQVADLDATEACLLDGVVYSPGQRLELDCRLRCTCQHGAVSCEDICPKTVWAPEQNCRLVSVPGQCCGEVRCEEDQNMQLCRVPKNIGTLRGELYNGERSVTGDVQRYPWAMLISTEDSVSYGGVIVSGRHILIFAPDLRGAKSLYIAPGKYVVGASLRQQTDTKMVKVKSVLLHPAFSDVGVNGSTISSILSRLQLIEFSEPFRFDKDFKPVNLPLSSSHCTRLSSTECPATTVGWDHADTQPDQMYLHAQTSKLDSNLCDYGLLFTSTGRVLTFAKSTGGKRTCVGGLARQDCSGPMGGVVVATAGADIDFMIGLLEQTWVPSQCSKPGTARLLLLCKYVDWIAASVP